MGQGAEIEPGSADHHRRTLNVRQPRRRHPLPMSDRPALGRVRLADQVMADPGAPAGAGRGAQDRDVAIELQGVGADDLGPRRLGKTERQG
ncbi:hypothetical protein GALL_500170 [mine drainage metagenome]|uniref:Uncharacterized protein n=1 Tax=mine drainage metagenome TaxID=410659 RepID=A0A1J5PKR9_9ZZZZ